MGIAAFLALVPITAVAQEIRSEISIQGTGFFTQDTQGNGVLDRATETGGFLIGYGYNFNRWLAAEANYGYDHNTQMYFGNTLARVQSNIHQFTGSAVVKLPGFARIQPYALAGAGALVFDPTGDASGSLSGATWQAKGAFLTSIKRQAPARENPHLEVAVVGHLRRVRLAIFVRCIWPRSGFIEYVWQFVLPVVITRISR